VGTQRSPDDGRPVEEGLLENGAQVSGKGRTVAEYERTTQFGERGPLSNHAGSLVRDVEPLPDPRST